MAAKKYNRINCDFYDQLEIHAMRKEKVEIFFTMKNGEDHLIKTLIENIYTKNKEEFLLTSCGFHIRLDKIISLKKINES